MKVLVTDICARVKAFDTRQEQSGGWVRLFRWIYMGLSENSLKAIKYNQLPKERSILNGCFEVIKLISSQSDEKAA